MLYYDQSRSDPPALPPCPAVQGTSLPAGGALERGPREALRREEEGEAAGRPPYPHRCLAPYSVLSLSAVF